MSAIGSNLDQSEILSSGNGLTENGTFMYRTTHMACNEYIHCSKELKEHPNAETQIFHFADPSVFVI